MRKTSILIVAVIALILVGAVGAVGATGPARPLQQPTLHTLTPRVTRHLEANPDRLYGDRLLDTAMTENFEGAWPGEWLLIDQSDTDGGEFLMGKRACYPHTGTYAGMSVGGGAQGQGRACDAGYPNNCDSWAVYGPISLAGATEAMLTFHLYGESEDVGTGSCDDDYLFIGASSDMADFEGAGVCGEWTEGEDGQGHYHLALDLEDWLGDSTVWVAFAFYSDASDVDAGFVIDDVAIEVTTGAATATPTTQRTPTRTRTPHSGSFRMSLPLALKPIPRESSVQRFTSTDGGVISTKKGFQLTVPPESVPFRTDGSDFEVAFSVETQTDPPAPMPDWVGSTGTTARFGPEGFSFVYPIGMQLPIPPVTDLAQLSMLRYDNATSNWVREPMAFSGETITTVSTAGYELGHRAVVVSPTGPETQMAASGPGLDDGMFWYDGALRISNCRSPHAHGLGTLTGRPLNYYLLLKSFTPKYAWQSGYVPNGLVLGTGTKPDASPANDTTWHLAQGTYQFCVSATEYYPPPISLAKKFMYADWITVTINKSSHNTCQTFACWDNVVEFPALDSGKWSETTPCAKNPTWTIPVGTGEFQSTLTWTNTTSAVGEMDLHLYCPNGEHIYWSNFQTTDGSVQLDRDMRYWDMGACIENIYSAAAMPPGNYTLKVHNYQYDTSCPECTTKNYQVRTIHGSTVRTYSGRLALNEWAVIETFTK